MPASKLSLKITQASLNQTALDWPQNMANHYKAIDIAVSKGSDLVLMPELSLTGYEVNDDFQRTDNNRIYAALSNIAAYAHALDKNLIVSVGAPWRLQLREAFENAAADPDILKNPLYDRLNQPFNTQVRMGGGRILGMTVKANLFRDERGYENRYFPEWSFRDAKQVAGLLGIDDKYGTIPQKMPDGSIVPTGRPILYVTDESGHSYILATGICEEKWAATKFDGYPYDDSRYERLNIIPSVSRYLGTKDGLLLEIANASPPSKLKQDKHMHLNELASQYADVVIDTDGLGTSGSTFAQFGHRLIAQDGQTISAGRRMSFAQVATTTSIVQISNADISLRNKAHSVLVREFKDPAAAPHTQLIWDVKGSGADWDNPSYADRWKEERIRNQAFWTYDYIRKVGSNVAVNASSGGQDSGYNITLDYVAIVLAMDELGVEQVCDDMNVPYKAKVMSAYADGGKEAAIEEFMKHYLIMYYMPTNNNSDEHEQGARVLSEGGIDENGRAFKGLGGRFKVRSIQDLVTMSAFVFGTTNTSDISADRKQKIMMELSTFVHASPKKYTPEEMQEWADRLQDEYPELEELTSVALPGHSIAYENFQARIRTVLIWAAANVHKGSPRANPNLTEGYTNNTTAAGDLQGGGFNPNGGIFKDDEQQLLKYLEEKGIPGIIPPIKALCVINGNKPTAGLLPKEDGEVTQNDEDTMQATMPQISILARLMHHHKIHTDNGERELNFGEVYRAAREKEEFNKQDNNQLFSTVANFYRRWYSGQFKIHMATIQPTFGENKDHQTSRRTPNISGQSRDEIVQLGIDLLFDWANEDGLVWNNYDLLQQRAWQDKKFTKDFFKEMANRDPSQPNATYNLRGVYDSLKERGWSGLFGELRSEHALNVIRPQSPELN